VAGLSTVLPTTPNKPRIRKRKCLDHAQRDQKGIVLMSAWHGKAPATGLTSLNSFKPYKSFTLKNPNHHNHLDHFA
jgi:hypothetical protein